MARRRPSRRRCPARRPRATFSNWSPSSAPAAPSPSGSTGSRTTRPVDGAVTLTLDGQEVAAERLGLGLFVARHSLLAQPESRDIVFTVSDGEEMDLLTATLEIPAAPGEARAARLGAQHAEPIGLVVKRDPLDQAGQYLLR